MPLRMIPALFLLAVALFAAVRRSKHGMILLALSVFINPASLIWGLNDLHIPLLIGAATFVAVVREGRLARRGAMGQLQSVLFLLLMGFLTLSAASGAYPARTFPMLENWVKLFILFSLVLRVVDDETDVHDLWFFILGAFGLLALRGVYHYLSGYDEIGGLPYSTTGDRNDFAMVLAMCCPVAHFFFRTRTGVMKLAFLGLEVLMMGVTILTYSRMGFLLVVLYAGILFLQSPRRLLLGFLMVPAALIAFSLAPESLVQRVESIGEYEQDDSSMGRIRAWRAGLKMMEGRPLTGVGLNSFEVPDNYMRYADLSPGSEDIPRVAHNAYVQIGAEAGVPALLLFLSLIGTTLFKGWRLRRESTDERGRLFANAMLISLLLYSCGAVFLSAEDRESLYVVIASVCAVDLVRRGKALPGREAAA